jgi:PAS domain S-box-containing protein
LYLFGRAESNLAGRNTMEQTQSQWRIRGHFPCFSRVAVLPVGIRRIEQVIERIRSVELDVPRGWRAFASLKDVKTRTRSAGTVGSSELRSRALAESTSAAIFVQCGDRLVEANSAACRITGYSREELLSLEMSARLLPEFRAVYSAKERESRSGVRTETPIEIRIRRKGGEERWLCLTMTSYEFHGVPALLGTAIDMTERRRIEERLAHAAKMKAIGQVSGALAHDFNNLLAVIIGNLDLLGAVFGNDQRAKKRMDTALGAAMRCSNLTRQMLAAACRQRLSPETVDLVAHVRSMQALFRTTARDGIELVDALGNTPLTVFVDIGGLETALLNLIVNAREAMPGGGRISLSAEVTSIDAEAAAEEQPGGLACGRYAVLTVNDNGPGMTPEVQASAFEPFFTTKKEVRSAGLGLAIVYGFCSQSGGDAQIQSTPGQGMTVRLYLPLAGSRAESTASVPETSIPPRGTERVVLVDDEAALLEVSRSWLEALGYSVTACSDPRDALRMIDESPFDLLLTDIAMPALNGYELAAQARARRPALALLYMSGFVSSAEKARRVVEAELLEKPFVKDHLARAVRRALAAGEELRRSEEP